MSRDSAERTISVPRVDAALGTLPISDRGASYSADISPLPSPLGQESGDAIMRLVAIMPKENAVAAAHLQALFGIALAVFVRV